LKEALNILAQKNPEIKNEVDLIVFGKTKVDLQTLLPLKLHPLGSLSSIEKIAMAYNAADLFVLPSLEDNLPNTVMESLSCGVPVVAFDTGGIPEMVQHGYNGFLAAQRSANELMEGISKIFRNEVPYQSLSDNARRKVLDNFTHERVVKKYIEVYQQSTLLP
jgi:glycosyltransferase involved in cell wall biosynthesis